MKNFNEFLQEMKNVFSICAEFDKFGAIKLMLNDRGLFYDINRSVKLSEVANKILEGVKSKADLIELYLMSKISAAGPKVFCPTDMQFAMLEHMTLNIEMADYTQPFETIIVEVPPKFQEAREALCPQSGRTVGNLILPETHTPSFVIINHSANVKSLMSMVMYSTGLGIKQSIVGLSGKTIEEYLHQTGVKFENTLDVSESEQEGTDAALRAALNYALLLDEVGVRKDLLKTNDSHRTRTREHLIKAQHRGEADKVKKLSLELRSIPVFYELNQDVVLHQSIPNNKEYNKDTGRLQTPHHRRGHYRMQPYGPKSELRKRIRIAPVFVNAEFFVGDMVDAKSTYHE